MPRLETLHPLAILGLTSFFLSSFSNWAPQNINSSCYCSSYSTNDTPVSRHLVSMKTTFCLRYNDHCVVSNVRAGNVSEYLAGLSCLTQSDAKKQLVSKPQWNELMQPLSSPHISVSNQPRLLVQQFGKWPQQLFYSLHQQHTCVQTSHYH